MNGKIQHCCFMRKRERFQYMNPYCSADSLLWQRNKILVNCVYAVYPCLYLQKQVLHIVFFWCFFCVCEVAKRYRINQMNYPLCQKKWSS